MERLRNLIEGFKNHVNPVKETENKCEAYPLSLLRESLILNEVPSGRIEEIYKLALARTVKSGLSFGLCQWDIANNQKAAAIFSVLLEQDEYLHTRLYDFYEIRGSGDLEKDSFYYLNEDQLDLISKVNNILKTELSRDIINSADEERMDNLIYHVIDVFKTILPLYNREICFLADMANQYGSFSLNGATITTIKEWQALDEHQRNNPNIWNTFKGETRENVITAYNLTATTCCNQSIPFDINRFDVFFLFFKLRTKHGRNLPQDVIRRWVNIIKVLNK